MSNVVKFNFETNNDKEIEINGELFTIPMDDDSKAKYIIATKKFGLDSQEVATSNENLLDMSDEDIKALSDKQRELMKDFIEAVLGKNTFAKMYKLAGKSAIKLMPLAQELARLVADVDEETYQANLNKYLQNGKK